MFILALQHYVCFIDLLLQQTILASQFDITLLELHEVAVFTPDEANHCLEFLHQLCYRLFAGSWVLVQRFSSRGVHALNCQRALNWGGVRRGGAILEAALPI